MKDRGNERTKKYPTLKNLAARKEILNRGKLTDTGPAVSKKKPSQDMLYQSQ